MESKGTGGKSLLWTTCRKTYLETYKMSQTDMESFVDEYVDTTTDEVNGLFDGIKHSYVQYSRKKIFLLPIMLRWLLLISAKKPSISHQRNYEWRLIQSWKSTNYKLSASFCRFIDWEIKKGDIK